jgi:glycosyltransferase involved in cell wall biosynthesis
MKIENRFLFNFAASYSGGGYKRLYEYAKWFNAKGGAWFVVHRNCRSLPGAFPNNRFFVVSQSRLDRLRSDCGYLAAIGEEIGQPQLYYSYGIPIYSRFGEINWFHLSNVLPLAPRGIPVPHLDRLRLALLRRRIRRASVNADVISAESKFSLGLIDPRWTARLFLSVNGSDDELDYIQKPSAESKDDIATIVGTSSHKALDDSFRVFEMLARDDARLKLMIIGNAKDVSRRLRRQPGVIVRGLLTRVEVISYLKRSKYYISTTLIENSYNAASEGIFIADESYISDIGPHRELLMDMRFDVVSIPMAGRRMLHVRRTDLIAANLKSWATVVEEMIEKFRHERQRLGHASSDVLDVRVGEPP